MNNKFKDFFGFGDNDSYEERDAYEEHYDEQEEMQNSNRPTNSRDSNVVSIKAGQAGSGPSKIVLYEPRVYSDAKEVAQNLLNQKAIIINFSRMDDASARRVVDFITGTVTPSMVKSSASATRSSWLLRRSLKLTARSLNCLIRKIL